jgi:hypothetical protein
MARYFNIANCTLGGTAVTTINTITTSSKTQRITSAGDADRSPTFQAKGMTDNDVSIEMEDPIQAEALEAAAAGDLVFEGLSDADSVRKRVTVKNFSVFGRDDKDAHNKVGTVSLKGNGYDPAGGKIITTVSV